MIIVDFSHLSMRNLYVAISQAKPKKNKETKKYNTEDFIKFYFHLMLSSLRYIQKKFGKEYGEIILAIDNRKYWRREYYPEYKGHRKKGRDESDVNFEEFFKYQEEFIKTLDEIFPYKVLEVEGAEADDIIGILSAEFSKDQDVLVVSSDKDMKQVLEHKNVKLYDPIQQKFITIEPEELKKFKLLHILLGDSGDNIPNVMVGTEFSDAFKAYLKNNDIYIDDPYQFRKMAISKKLLEEFNIEKKNRKGETTGEKDIYKTPRFGEKTALKYMEGLRENLKSNPIVAENFIRNKKLILFSEIPDEIKNKIIEGYEKSELKYDSNGIMEFLMKNNLQEQMMNITDFYIIPNSQNKADALSSWSA